MKASVLPRPPLLTSAKSGAGVKELWTGIADVAQETGTLGEIS